MTDREYDDIMKFTVFRDSDTVEYDKKNIYETFKYLLHKGEIIELSTMNFKLGYSNMYLKRKCVFSGFRIYSSTGQYSIQIKSKWERKGYPFIFDSLEKAVGGLSVLYKSKMKTHQKNTKSFETSKKSLEEITVVVSKYFETHPEHFI